MSCEPIKLNLGQGRSKNGKERRKRREDPVQGWQEMVPDYIIKSE